ncbi:Pkinase-domain-containing protein [Meredithblackwellia eburnea MCA 4105]
MYGAGSQRGRGHQPGSSVGGSLNGRKAELTTAYASLAAELTRKELKSVGGYTIGRVIGKGSFGKVHLGLHRLTNTRVAIKQVPKSLPFTSDPSSPLSLLTREIHHHRRLRHPHILGLYEIIATESYIYLITELCTGGELFDYLVEKGRLSVSETRRVFGQLVLGVAHLHSCGVVHRDLKLENVLLDERVNVKIADLGFGREFEKGRWMETWVGTLGYCAPEVVAAKRYLGEEVDIWSLGVIFYTLLTGSLPFDDDDEGIMKEKILKCEYDIPTWLDEDAVNLIQGILQLDPLRRMSLKSMLAHPFFTRSASRPVFDDSPSNHHHHHSHSHSHSHRHGNHHHHHHHHHSHMTPDLPAHDTFPPPIPEESSPISRPTSELRAEPLASLHPVPEASTSASTYHSASSSGVSDSSFFSADSDMDRGHSGATTPITSDDGLHDHLSNVSAVKEGKRRAQDQGDSGDLRSVLNRNESETTIGRPLGEDGVEATPRGSIMGITRLPTNTEESDEVTRSAWGSGAYPSSLGLSAPLLQRNASASSTGSCHSLGGSPAPVHTRTPSRTKRHSIGSVLSERMYSIDDDPLVARIDYLALLSTPYPPPLSTAAEKQLLESLTLIGFDSGQITHSVQTDACDSSGAVWWMLKRKLDMREQERLETEAVNGAIVERLKQPSAPKDVGPLASSPTNQYVSPDIETVSLPDHDGGDSRRPSVEDSLPQTPPTDSGYFLHQGASGSASAPLLPFFPSNDLASPSSKKVVRSKSKDYLTSASTPSSPAPVASPTSLNSTPKEESAKTKRSRSTSVSMLARATSVLGNSLALKKSTDAVKDDAKADEGGRSTPTLVSMFSRKGSLSDELIVPTDTPSSPRKTPVSELDGLTTPKRRQDPPKSASPQPSPSLSNSDSQDTFATVTSSSSQRLPSASNTPAKKAQKNNLFSNLKTWFGDDRRKRSKRTNSTHSNEVASSSRNGTVVRRASRPPAETAYVGSPLKRPIPSRRSSNGSIVPPSRRSSINSVHRARSRDASTSLVTPAHHRRRSDGSRTSASDVEHSRPPSIRSTVGVDRIPQHHKAPSISSTGSHRGTPSQSAKDVYRRPPTTTTVRRVQPHTRHSRTRSGGSSVTRHSSSSSIGDSEMIGEEQKNADPILEEDESEVFQEDRAAGERERAFRKLSGDMSAHASELHRSMASRVSLDSHNSSSGRHSPIIFSAHKTRHVFGAPSQPSSSSIGRKSSHSTLRPALRDVFAVKEGDDEWVDEEDLTGYGGGLGQSSVRASHRPDSSASTSSGGSSLLSASTAPSSQSGDRESFEYPNNSSIGMFEGRYAGIMAAQAERQAEGVGNWRGNQGARQSAFRSAVVIEEDEEDEEDEG